MPHGPVLENYYVAASVKMRQYHVTGYGPSDVDIPGQAIVEWRYVRKDATVNNPKRPDGSRPVSAYSMDQILVQNAVRRIAQVNPVTIKPGSWGWYTKSSTRAYVLPLANLPAEFVLSRQEWLPSVRRRTNTDALARTRFLNKLADASGKDKVQLGVMAGEARETIGMAHELARGLVTGIRKTASSVGQSPTLVSRALDSIRRYGVKETARRLLHGDVAALERTVQAWLVYQFGLKPLAYDLYDSSVYLQTELLKTDNYLTVAVRSGSEEVWDDTERLVNYGTNDATYAIDGLVRKTCKVDFSCKYEIPTTTTLTQDLGLYNPALVAWELIRFSWMVDYAIGIGDWLRSTMAAQDTRPLEGTRSETLVGTLLSWRDAAPGSAWPTGPLGDPPLVLIRRFNRTVLNNGVMPSFLPGVKLHLGLNQLANSLAALTVTVGARQSGGPWHLK